jgi:hypothetical protein
MSSVSCCITGLGQAGFLSKPDLNRCLQLCVHWVGIARFSELREDRGPPGNYSKQQLVVYRQTGGGA